MITSRLSTRDSLLFVYGTLRPFVDIPIARWQGATIGRIVKSARVDSLAGALSYVDGLRFATRARACCYVPNPARRLARTNSCTRSAA